MFRDDDETLRPIPPVRSDVPEAKQAFLPAVPPRQDLSSSNQVDDVRPTDSEFNRYNRECTCNYNRYATKKTIGHGFLEFALITSNAMQLRSLIIQKQRDGIWIASLVLVTLSIVTQLGLAYVLIVVGKGNIEKPEKQRKLEKFNNLALFLTVLVSVINVIINVFMSTTTSQSYMDPSVFHDAQHQQ